MFRRIIAKILISCMLFSILPSAAFAAESGSAGTISWTIDSNGLLTISGTGEIPENAPFVSKKMSINNVQINSGITTIGAYAFYDFTNLKTVSIPNTVTEIGTAAFFNCSHLEHVTIPEGTQFIGSNAFRKCSNLKSVAIPKSIRAIEYKAFYQCNQLMYVFFADSESKWQGVGIQGDNDALHNAIVHYNATDHVWKEATCIEKKTCSVCALTEGTIGNHDYGDLIPHRESVHSATTLQASVAAHYFCDNCKTYFTEDKVETTLEELTGQIPVHSFGDWINTDPDKHWKECSCDLKSEESVHNYSNDTDIDCNTCSYVREIHICGNGILMDGQDATCTENGWKDYYKCSCNKLYQEQNCTTLIANLESWKTGVGKITASHTYGELIAAQELIHTETVLQDGIAAHYQCSVCYKYFTEENKAETTLGALTTVAVHSYGNWINTDVTAHWRQCSCGLKSEESVHDYTDNMDSDCNICGYIRIIAPSTPSYESGFSNVSIYPITVNKVDGADVTLSEKFALAGETIIITVIPNTGIEVNDIIVKDTDGNVISVTKEHDHEYIFSMPESSVSISVTTVSIESKLRVVLQIDSKIILVNDTIMMNDVAPFIAGNRTMVPIRVITELLGGVVHWNHDTRTVQLEIDGKELSMTIGKEIPGYSVSAIILDDRTFVPVRYVMENLGAEVEWIEDTQQIVIQK